MKRKEIEDLVRGAGVSDEEEIKKTVDSIMKINGDDVTSLKTKIANLEEDAQVNKGVIDTKNAKIKELEGIDVEALKKEQFELGKAEGTKEIEQIKFNNAVNEALKNYKVKDKNDIAGHLDMSKITAEKDEQGNITKIAGLDEQIKTLQENKAYLFDNDEPKFSAKTASTSPTPTSENLLSALKEHYKK